MLAVVVVDQRVKQWIARRLPRPRAIGPLVLCRSLHVERLAPRRLWGGPLGAAAVLLAILLGIGGTRALLGRDAAAPLLALSVAAGGAASNVLDLWRHDGIVNGAAWNGRLTFNLADLAIAGGAALALGLWLGAVGLAGASEP
jgi:lipoprotein signal peptidase